ncbi:hypothetical protein SI65_00387 [Aspergillus cristatus]|uniref:NmrA-like domain-containing protein n=1 Tax=Aspergillus cristatus TaxID=573508 RepID=A0A1E3BPE7_ASPCR|nr:hypothetical protein SI65_00387 [Aspergillus cristatus]
MTTTKVAIVGASGESGQSIVNALLDSSTPKYEVTALTRPQSIHKPVNTKLQERGVKVVPADLGGPSDKLVELLTGIDVVISAIYFDNLDEEIPLANAAKAAGVKRFVQSALMIVIPPKGKEDNLHYFQKIRLPYTYIDTRWWYQLTLPRLPSGRIDHLLSPTHKDLPIGFDGSVPTALADLRDVGRFVARVIADPRTLNKRVHVYSELYTQNKVYEVVEGLSGEKLPRGYVSEKEASTNIDNARARLQRIRRKLAQSSHLLLLSCSNLGDLYPDFEYVTFEDYVKEVLDGKVKGVYQG